MSPSVHSEDSLESTFDEQIGFQQKITKFHQPEPEPEPLHPPPLKAIATGKIKKTLKTKILPVLHPQKVILIQNKCHD